MARCRGGQRVDDCLDLIEGLGEECDGLDNDCDEVVDEGLAQWVDLGTACGLGVCESTVKSSCQEGEAR